MALLVSFEVQSLAVVWLRSLEFLVGCYNMDSTASGLFGVNDTLLVFEEVTLDFYKEKSCDVECGLLKTKSEKFSEETTKYVKKYHIIVPPWESNGIQFQYYIAARADVPHYQIKEGNGPDSERYLFFMKLYEKHPSMFCIYDRSESWWNQGHCLLS